MTRFDRAHLLGAWCGPYIWAAPAFWIMGKLHAEQLWHAQGHSTLLSACICVQHP